MARASSWIKRALPMLLGLLLALAALAIGGLLYLRIPQNAAGMAAKGVCSAAFVAGRPRPTLMADDVLAASAVLGLINVALDENARAVPATLISLSAGLAGIFIHGNI